jgi:hypothetical protein
LFFVLSFNKCENQNKSCMIQLSTLEDRLKLYPKSKRKTLKI